MSMALMTFRFASLHLKAALLFLDLEDDIFVRLQLSTWCVSESTMDEVFPRLPFIIIVCSRVSWFLLVNTHSFSSVETGTSPCRIWPSQQFRFFLTWSSSPSLERLDFVCWQLSLGKYILNESILWSWSMLETIGKWGWEETPREKRNELGIF